MKIKFDPAKLLPAASILVGLAGMVIGNLNSANEKKILKAEIKDDVLKELSNK